MRGQLERDHRRRTSARSAMEHTAILKHYIAPYSHSGSIIRCDSSPPMLSVDARERLLIEVLRRYDITHTVKTLPVGDIICEYDDGTTWVAERKRADDLANGIKTGRWREQQSRMFAAGSPIFIIEGDLRNASLPYKSMLGAVVNCELRDTAHVFRTWDINETAHLLTHLAEKMQAMHAAPSGFVTAKRKRDTDPDICWMRQLMCIPSISEKIARKLLDEFGSLSQLQDALRSDGFPCVRLDERACLGAARRDTLAKYLLGRQGT